MAYSILVSHGELLGELSVYIILCSAGIYCKIQIVIQMYKAFIVNVFK